MTVNVLTKTNGNQDIEITESTFECREPLYLFHVVLDCPGSTAFMVSLTVVPPDLYLKQHIDIQNGDASSEGEM